MLESIFLFIKNLYDIFFKPFNKAFSYLNEQKRINSTDSFSYAKFKHRQKRLNRVNDEY
jgi:hypothetical protein